MKWKLIQHRIAKGRQDIQVAHYIKELVDFTQTTYADGLELEFKSMLGSLKRTNIYSVDLFYKMVKINIHLVEVCKLNVHGDLKYKMFSIAYLK